jgi:hypothetical protein
MEMDPALVAGVVERQQQQCRRVLGASDQLAMSSASTRELC